MPKEQINEFLALPWEGLSAQINSDIARAIECFALEHLTFDTGEELVEIKTKLGRVKLARYRVWLRLDSAEFHSSLGKPPGYEKMSASDLVFAAPLDGEWSAATTLQFSYKIRVWNHHGDLLSISGKIPQGVELRRVKIRGRLRLNTAEPDRPRLEQTVATVKLQLVLSGLIDATITLPTSGFEFEPPDIYRVMTHVSANAPTLPGISSVGFEGFVIITVMPTLRLGFDGNLVFRLIKVSAGSVSGLVTAKLPFSFDIDTHIGTRHILDDYLPQPGALPRSWGEHPPDNIINDPAEQPPVPTDFDFIEPARSIEEAVVPTDPGGAPIPTGTDAPHHAPWGLIYEVRTWCDGSRAPIYETYHDTAIWTGHFLAAEAFRYAVDPTPEVLQRVQCVLGGIDKLFHVTGVSGLFARAALPDDSPFQTDPPMTTSTLVPGTDQCHPGNEDAYYPSTDIGGVKWSGFGRGEFPTSRDSYMGITLGFACAHQLVPPVQATVSAMVTRMVNFLLKHGWNVPTPPNQRIKTTFFHEFHHQLAILRLAKTVNQGAFGTTYDHYAGAADFSWVPVWGTTLDPISKYYKFNLTHAALGVLLFLEDDLPLRQHYWTTFRMLRRATCHHRNAHFNLVRVLAALPAERAHALAERSCFDRCISLRDETRALLRDWLIRRCCVPGPLGLPTERPPDPAYLKSLYRRKLQSPYAPIWETEPGCDWVSLWPLPVHKRGGSNVDFAWQRPPFQTDTTVCRHTPKYAGQPSVDAGHPDIEGPGLDYLLPVWMARYLGVV